MPKASKPKGGAAGRKSGIRGDTKPRQRNVLTKQGETKYVVVAPPPEGSGLVTTLRPAAYGLIRRMAGNGRTLAAIAAALGLTPRTFRGIRDKDQEVEAALEVGVADLDLEVTDMLLTAARKGSITAMIFFAKARLGWVEGQPAPMGVNVKNMQVNITIPPAMSAEEAQALIEKSGVAAKLHPALPGPSAAPIIDVEPTPAPEPEPRQPRRHHTTTRG